MWILDSLDLALPEVHSPTLVYTICKRFFLSFFFYTENPFAQCWSTVNRPCLLNWATAAVSYSCGISPVSVPVSQHKRFQRDKFFFQTKGTKTGNFSRETLVAGRVCAPDVDKEWQLVWQIGGRTESISLFFFHLYPFVCILWIITDQ